MPNLRSISQDAIGITLVASNGKSVTILYADIKVRFGTETGSARQRGEKTAAWVAGRIEAALGAEMVPTRLIDLLLPAAGPRVAGSFDSGSGKFSSLELR